MTTLISKSTLSPTNTKGVRLQMIRRLINLAERYVSAVEESHPGNRNLRPHATTFYGPPIQIKVIYESKKDEFMMEVTKKVHLQYNFSTFLVIRLILSFSFAFFTEPYQRTDFSS